MLDDLLKNDLVWLFVPLILFEIVFIGIAIIKGWKNKD